MRKIEEETQGRYLAVPYIEYACLIAFVQSIKDEAKTSEVVTTKSLMKVIETMEERIGRTL